MTVQLDENRVDIAKVTWVSVLTNFVLCIIKVIFGMIGHSQAVVADGIHSLSDLSTDFAIIIGVKFWSKPPDEDHPHGHYKIETIITVLIGLIIFIMASGILYNAVISIQSPKLSTPTWTAFFAAVFSILIKEVLFRWTKYKAKEYSSSALMANALHQRSDAISSVPAALSVLLASVFPSISFIDQIGAVIVAVLIYKSSFEILRPALAKLTDTGLSEDETLKIYNIAKSIQGVKGVHDVRTRHIGGMKVACDLHIEVDGNLSVKEAHDIYSEVKKSLLNSNLPLVDIIVHIDPYRK